MPLINLSKEELKKIEFYLLKETDPKGNGLTDKQKAMYMRLSDLMEKVSEVRNATY